MRRGISQKYLQRYAQKNLFGPTEIIIVDSGSTDKTIEIAESFHCKILEISPESFTFGKALNIGFERRRARSLSPSVVTVFQYVMIGLNIWCIQFALDSQFILMEGRLVVMKQTLQKPKCLQSIT